LPQKENRGGKNFVFFLLHPKKRGSRLGVQATELPLRRFAKQSVGGEIRAERQRVGREKIRLLCRTEVFISLG